MLRSRGLGFLVTFAWMMASGEMANAFDISFDVSPPPGQLALATRAFGISNNGGYVVGYATNPTNSALAGYERLANGTITSPIVAPGDNSNYTRALGVNNLGTVVGDFLNLSGATYAYHGFILGNGGFTQFDVGGPFSTSIFGINDAGNIVGPFGSTAQANEDFVRIGGVLSEFTIAGATSLFGLGINDNDQVIGQYTDASGVTHGYLRSASGVITTFDAVPGATSTTASGINDAGTIVGYYTDAGGTHGYTMHGSTVATFSVFGSASTVPRGINDLGQVTGDYRGSDQVIHGFIAPAAVPGPASLVMLGIGLGGLGAFHRRMRRPDA